MRILILTLVMSFLGQSAFGDKDEARSAEEQKLYDKTFETLKNSIVFGYYPRVQEDKLSVLVDGFVININFFSPLLEDIKREHIYPFLTSTDLLSLRAVNKQFELRTKISLKKLCLSNSPKVRGERIGDVFYDVRNKPGQFLPLGFTNMSINAVYLAMNKQNPERLSEILYCVSKSTTFLYLGWSDLFLNLDSLNHLIDLKFLHIPSTKVCTSGISSERNSRSITQEQILSLLPNLPNLKIISFGYHSVNVQIYRCFINNNLPNPIIRIIQSFVHRRDQEFI